MNVDRSYEEIDEMESVLLESCMMDSRERERIYLKNLKWQNAEDKKFLDRVTKRIMPHAQVRLNVGISNHNSRSLKFGSAMQNRGKR